MSDNRQELLDGIAAMLPAMQDEAARLDAVVKFPQASFVQLRKLGALRATIPKSLGGLGFGYKVAGATALLNLFVLLGEGSLSVARLYEAHVNTLQLVFRYGTPALAEQCAANAAAGELFALWVTDAPQASLALRHASNGFILEGRKAFCSGAGEATRALVTAATENGIRMIIVSLTPGERLISSASELNGMRAAITGSVDFSGMRISPDVLLGEPGDYLREPVFSAGAWRGSAGALGGLGALLKIHRDELLKRQRTGDPHQQAKFGQVVLAYETARLWTTQAALRGCLEDDSADAIVAYINLARLAVESACLAALHLIQRGLGLSAFVVGHPAERLCRDLATYLRQPAPDEALVKAAQYYFHANVPGAT